MKNKKVRLKSRIYFSRSDLIMRSYLLLVVNTINAEEY